MIEVRHLRYFVVVAEELHFGRAAQRLHMAQSPLSQQIRRLEKELGVELLARGHHVVGLTDAGRAFLAGAQRTLTDLDTAARQARRAARGEVGTLVVGYVSEVTADLLPLSLKAFKQRHVDVELDLREGSTGELLEALRQHQVDIAFARSPRFVDDLAYEELVIESLVAALPETDAGEGAATPITELSGERFVMPSFRGTEGLRRDIDAACEAAGFQPRVARETSPLSAVLLLVAAGAGVALVPASVAHMYPVPGVAYVSLAAPVPSTTAGMLWRPDDSSRIVSGFLDATRRIAHRHDHQPDVWPEREVDE